MLVVFIFCASIASLAAGLKSHQLGIELEAEGVSVASEGEPLVDGTRPDAIPRGFYSHAMVYSNRLPTVAGSDAYPSSILHGPPVQGLAI